MWPCEPPAKDRERTLPTGPGSGGTIGTPQTPLFDGPREPGKAILAFRSGTLTQNKCSHKNRLWEKAQARPGKALGRIEKGPWGAERPLRVRLSFSGLGASEGPMSGSVTRSEELVKWNYFGRSWAWRWASGSPSNSGRATGERNDLPDGGDRGEGLPMKRRRGVGATRRNTEPDASASVAPRAEEVKGYGAENSATEGRALRSVNPGDALRREGVRRARSGGASGHPRKTGRAEAVDSATDRSELTVRPGARRRPSAG